VREEAHDPDMNATQLVPHTRGLFLGGWRLRVWSWWKRPELDRALAAGADPLRDDLLSLRAGQLRAAAWRGRFARALRAAITCADSELATRPWPEPLVRYDAVRCCRSVVALVADRLESDQDPGVRGLAIVSLLLHDGESPLFYAAAPDSLEARLRLAYDCL
jgi:hypothetical protein